MKTLFAILIIITLAFTPLVHTYAQTPAAGKPLVAIGNEVRAALSSTVTLKAPVQLVEKPKAKFWAQPALKGQEVHWTIKVPAYVFLGWMAKTDGMDDLEKKAVGDMAKKADFESFMAPLRESAKKADSIAGDGKSLASTIASLDDALAKAKKSGIDRSLSDAINAMMQTISRPSFRE